MSEEFNKNKSFSDRLRALKLNRPALVSTCLLLVAIITVTAVAIISNRSDEITSDTPDTLIPPVSEPPSDTQDTTPPPADSPSSAPSEIPSSPVEDKLPSFSLPVSGVLSKAHDPSNQVFSSTMNDYRVHIGVDIVTEASAPVYSAADGKISKIWNDTLMGYCIAIKHSGNCYTIYKNLSKTLPDGISEGASVRSGQLIASVGDSAMLELAEEPHLHFEMTVADLGVDPLKYFDEKALASLGIDASHGE